jgi:cellulose synthase/poly-beta-1,6-N-acetylglucosamine synthase-like glycosyltransferase
MRPAVSIAVVTRGLSPAVARLTSRILEMPGSPDDREVLIVAEDATVAEPTGREPAGDGVALVRIPAGRGLGYDRNRAIETCAGDVIVFVDDDCWPDDGWLPELLAPLADPAVDAVMGGVRIAPSTFLGDSISALGFPAGGSVGFSVMFHVDENGLTDHLSTLNCALRRSVFEKVGTFDETMTMGSEDTELSHRIAAAGMRMRFQPSAMVEHRARTDLAEFAGWFFRRGRGAYQLSRRVDTGPVIAHRLTTYRHIIGRRLTDPKIVLIVPLLVFSVFLQEAGFVWEAIAHGEPPRRPSAAA